MSENKKHESHLKVKSGIKQPISINTKGVANLISNKKGRYLKEKLVEGILKGDRAILGQAITLIESTLPKDNEQAQQIIEECLPLSGKSLRIGITGVPGAGKSTFIEALGKYITGLGYKLAVLAIDPSSIKSKGSILADKTRMEQLSTDKNAFIRPSPSAGTLGGVARKTRNLITLCEAAGFNIILIETVGVGQSETIVHSMVDYFLLLLLAGAGDEIQGIKRGIIEMADAILINKADGDNVQNAQKAKGEYQNALHLYPLPESGWKPTVEVCSALYKTGIKETWQTIMEYQEYTFKNGYLKRNRNNQSKYSMYEEINQTLTENFYRQEEIKKAITVIEKEVLSNKITSHTAAGKLIEMYFGNLKK